ncbi:MAG: gliding motility-associated C-terminal domain-containing protein [Bacteroidales bacterium]|nr:gliding motility-associated C-terminal domain-containing protein [Bacteroidales bacterium]
MSNHTLLKIMLFCCLTIHTIVATAQIAINNTNQSLRLNTNLIDVDEVIMINGITSTTTLSYNGSGTIQWRNHQGQLLSTTNNVPISNATGYSLTVNGQKISFVWVIDYALYYPNLGELNIIEGDDVCERIQLTNTSTAPNILYGDSLGAMHALIREYTLRYQDYIFTNDSLGTWEYVNTDTTLIGIPSLLYLPAPLNNTTFVFFGDQYAKQMGLQPDSITIDYYAKAIKAYPTGTVIERDGLNEVDRSSQTDISGSAPLVVECRANANTPIATFFKWTIYNFDNLQVMAHYNDASFTYTFNETGSYVAKIEVMGDGTCEVVDSLLITVRDSYIEVPNVFTPNGDGINDEFRIAYRSIKQYSIKVVNRYGVLVYSSNDPTKGWDGNIHGQPAAEGTYFYFIEALGADKEEKRDRYIKYKKSGAINLLR